MSEVTTLTGKEEYIAQCVATGKTREVCEKQWDAGHGEKTLDKETDNEKEMLKVQVAQLRAALRESTDIITKFQKEADAVENARKYELALEMERESNGKFKHNDLMSESLDDLAKMKKAVDTIRPKDYLSISQLSARDEQKQKPRLTVGTWNPDTHRYEGGV